MGKKFIATLAFLCALAILTVQGHSHSRHRSCKTKACKKPFYFDKHDCECHCGKRSRDCFYPQVLNRNTCQCQCPPELNESSCINWQEWDDDWCECYCPYSRNHKCSPNKVWNYKKCNCDCINKEPKVGCVNGRWSKSNCQCVLNTTTTTTKKVPITTVTTQAPTQPPTQAPTQPPTQAPTQPPTQAPTQPPTQAPTQPPVICSYGTKVYNNESSIDGIVLGIAVDATTAYVGITEVDGVLIPGTFMLNNSITPGLNYVYNNNVKISQTSNVFYLTQIPGCNCQFFDKNETLPANSYIVTLNNGTNALGIGSVDNVGRNFNISTTVAGSIINELLHYFDGYEKIDSITTNYKILVCGSESVMPATTTTTTPSTTTITTSSNNSTISTDSDEKRLDDIVNAFTNAALDAVQTLTNLDNLKNESIFDLHYILADDNTTTQAEAIAYQQILGLINSTTFGRRRKRQTQTIDTCQNATQQVQNAVNALNTLQTYYNQVQNLMLHVYNISMNTDNFTLRAEAHDMVDQYLAQLRNLTAQINECKRHLTALTSLRNEICSKTTTTIATTTTTTAAPVVCPYSWNPYAGNNLPPSDAFYVGKNPYGHDIYVGAGTGGNDLAPGSLEPAYLNGVTMETSFVVYNVTNNVTYLAIPSTCRCQWLPNGDLYSMSALVRLRSVYWVGRYNFTDGSHVVGKIYDQGSGYGITMSRAENNQEIQGTVFDVLQCVVSSNNQNNVNNQYP